jgi:hypothetical protein
MVKQQKIQSFFKRKRDEEAVDQDKDLHLLVLKKYVKWWRNTIQLILHSKRGMG